MKAVYRNALKLKMDKLWHEGWVQLDRWELLSFFDQRRVTKAVWQEIQEVWAEMYDDPDDAEPLSYVTVRSEESVTTPHSFLLINRNQMRNID
ncbi:hypothetical protein [Vibrio sp. 10N.261.46.A3]|uniref:hypothetical protein n=1 Tax=Vibrio sp. 10N.261.46.A3 TaxID=3229658 RepID=UPI003552E78D